MKIRNVVCVLVALGVFFTGCSGKSGSALSFTAGTYEGNGNGYGGKLTLAVTANAKSITKVEVVSHSETPGIGAAALPRLCEAVVKGQTLAIDSVSGATVTSTAFKQAATEALSRSGADMAALEKPSATVKAPVKAAVTLNTDVVVVGAGGAGLAAALTAAQNGARVIVLEKMAMIGGASAMAGGGTNATGSQWQKDLGIADDPEYLFMDLMKNGHFTNDPRTLWLYATTVGRAFDWLVDPSGASLPYVKQASGASAEHRVGRTFSPQGGGAGVVNGLFTRAQATGIQFMLETPAKKLITKDGAVIGVEALGADGTPYMINSKSVILATGGYGADRGMIPESVKKFPYAGAVSATGDGLKMARDIGALTFNLDKINIQPHSIKLPDGRGQHTYQACLAMYGGTGSILVSDKGERFVNERGSADSIKQAMMQNSRTFLVMDSPSFETYAKTAIASQNFTQSQLDSFLAANGTSDPVFVKADTLEQLASLVQMNGGVLKSSVDTYNGFVKNGKDTAFGRTVSKPMSGTGPYYLVEMNLRYYATLGGLRVNDLMQVVSASEMPIKGLYAAGEVVGGECGDIYAPGALFGWAMTSGHNAGLSVAANLKRN